VIQLFEGNLLIKLIDYKAIRKIVLDLSTLNFSAVCLIVFVGNLEGQFSVYLEKNSSHHSLLIILMMFLRSHKFY